MKLYNRVKELHEKMLLDFLMQPITTTNKDSNLLILPPLAWGGGGAFLFLFLSTEQL